MTTAQFRAQPELVSEMRKLLESDIFKLWWEAIEESENPANFLVSTTVTPHYAHIMLGQQTGYGVFKQRFLLGGRGIEIPETDRGPQTYAEPAPVEE